LVKRKAPLGRALFRSLLLGLPLLLSACAVSVRPVSAPARIEKLPDVPLRLLRPDTVLSEFAEARARIEPLAEEICEAQTTGMNCNFRIGIDPTPDLEANAYQTQDRLGRPVIIFTSSMMAQLANNHEIAFVMSHEAAHHIRAHLVREYLNARRAGETLARSAAEIGANPDQIQIAREVGQLVGARVYSKAYELEADELGTIIADYAGYDPRVGVRFFYRLPDPGDRFLGSHPPNEDRIEVVKRTIETFGLD
jgi:predicted Zn-dependent protease